MTAYRCLSCKETFEFPDKPDYCPACGLPRNEQWGMSVANSNPNITGFLTLP